MEIQLINERTNERTKEGTNERHGDKVVEEKMGLSGFVPLIFYGDYKKHKITQFVSCMLLQPH
jgi:hypothetical protein